MNKQYLVLNRTNGITKRGDSYCLLKLKATDDELSLAVWDIKPTDAPVVGQIVSFDFIQEGGDGKKSARVTEMHVGSFPQEGDELYGLIPRPIKREKWDECINKLVSLCTEDTLKSIIREMSDTLFTPYSQYPAATNVHHAFKGGLLNHIYQMLHMLEGLYPCLPYPIKLEHCVLAILFHDYGKVYEYTPEGETKPDMYLLGHIYISANRLQKILEEHKVPTADINHILHIVLAHHGQMEYGSPVLPCTQEAILVTHLDNISAKMDNMDITPNMERSFALGTHVVKE